MQATSASKWLIRDERKMETGRISDGKTVFVIRFAFSSRVVAERMTVSWKNSHGRNPSEEKNGVIIGHFARRAAPASGRSGRRTSSSAA